MKGKERAQAIRDYKSLIKSLAYLRGNPEILTKVSKLKEHYNL